MLRPLASCCCLMRLGLRMSVKSADYSPNFCLPLRRRTKCLATLADEQNLETRIQHARKIKRLIPDCPPPSSLDCDRIYEFLENSKKLVVLTGAGVSTESGIPDYRGPNGAYSTGFNPTTHQQFVKSLQTRRRYWARSYIGWRRFSSAEPGSSHVALAELERTGRVLGMITQNVDRLHHKAGSNPIELHGTTHTVICLSCGNLTDRQSFQERLKLSNLTWSAAVEMLERGEPGSDATFGMQQRPDGDIEIDDSVFERDDFQIPDCDLCGGTLKPDVVFFGDSVPKQRTQAAASLVQNCDSLLVVGSSLMVYSAFRLARSAHELGVPIALLNAGKTRADDLASVKIECRAGELLSKLVTMGSLSLASSLY